MKRRIVATLLAAVITATTIGCGGAANQGAAAAPEGSPEAASETSEEAATVEAAESSDAKEASAGSASKYQTTYGSKQFDNVTISVELFDRSNAPEGSTITENRWTKYCRDAMAKVGINVEFVAVPRGDEVTKMQTMMSTNTAPTILGTYTFSYARDYFDQGGIWDLTDFVAGDDQAVNLKKYIGQNCLDFGTTENGQTFGIVARRATVAQHNIFIRKDWLDALGLDVPKNTDELYEACVKFVNENPDGLAPSEVFGAIFDGLSQWNNDSIVFRAFSKDANDKKALAVGSGFEYYTDEGYIDYLKYVNKFYNEGLMNKEYFAQSDDQLKEYFVTDRIGFLEANVGYNVDILRGGLLQTLKENYPNADMIAMHPFESNVYPGESFQPAYGEGGLMCFCPLTATEEQVEAAITYLDWLSTEEGGFAIYHGIEGEHFNYNEDGVPIPIDADFNQKDKDWIRTDLFLVGNQGYFTDTESFNLNIAADNPGWEQYTIDDYEAALEGTLIAGPLDLPTPESQVEASNDLNIVRENYLTKCITCNPEEVEGIYEEWRKAAEDAGIRQVLADREAVYDAVHP